MQINVLKTRENKLLQRNELELEISDSKTTPARKVLLGKIAETVGSKPELVAIQKVEQQFGTHSNKVWVRIYKNRETLEKTESKHVVGRDKGEKKKPGKKKKEAQAPAKKK